MPDLIFLRKDGSEIPHPEETISLLTSVIEQIMGEATEPTYPYIGRLITIRTLCEDTLEKIK